MLRLGHRLGTTVPPNATLVRNIAQASDLLAVADSGNNRVMLRRWT